MDQGDLTVDNATNEDVRGIGYGSKDCVDVTTPRMSPPASFDGPVGDFLGKPGNGPFAGYENDSMFSNKGNGFVRGHMSGGRGLELQRNRIRAAGSSGIVSLHPGRVCAHKRERS
jgi:hypothetical protein